MTHPNRVPFSGVLTKVGVPSDKAPSGARGHRVRITQKAAREAVSSLIGMAVDFKDGWDGHDARQKCGVIMHASVKGDEILVRGHIYGRHFPEVVEAAARDDLGMSYEVADAHVEDMRVDVWTLDRITFVGAAILQRKKAAYHSTRFCLEIECPSSK